MIVVVDAAVTIPREFTVTTLTADADPYVFAVTPESGKSTLNVPLVIIGFAPPVTEIVDAALVKPTDVTVPGAVYCQDISPAPFVVNTCPTKPVFVGYPLPEITTGFNPFAI